MILLQPASKFLLQILQTHTHNGSEKAVDIDCQSVEFDDVRYHVQFSVKRSQSIFVSMALPIPPLETIFFDALPFGSMEALKAAYGPFVEILDPPKDGYNLTMKLDISNLPDDEEQRDAILFKVASVREVVLGAPLRLILKHLALRTTVPNLGPLVALVYRPNESFFLFPQVDKVTIVFPMRFKDSGDTVVATSFLQVIAETCSSPGFSSAPPCTWSMCPPSELKDAPPEILNVNGGYVTFVIQPRHVEIKKLDRVVWCISTFHAFVSYHVKCSESFMHTRMRRRVESLVETLDRAKSDGEEPKQMLSRSFKKTNKLPARGYGHSF